MSRRDGIPWDTEVFCAVLVHAFNDDNRNGFLCASVPLW